MTAHQTTLNDLLEILTKINENLSQINVRLQNLKTVQTNQHLTVKEFEVLDVMTLLTLPDHLRKTAMILIRLGQATAGEIAEESGRARAVESGYLNQLVVMGYVTKQRRGRDVYFTIKDQLEADE
jgi:DNA-binding transcriptional ArsR family regulator